MKNYYPEKAVVPYKKTSVDMRLIEAEINSLPADRQVKIMAYIIVRNESWNGKAGLNNNYAGIQADSGRWQAKYDDRITGVVIKNENKTKALRYFCAFDSYETCLSMLVEKLASRGMYIGGKTHVITSMEIKNSEDLCVAYYREWVTGEPDYVPDETAKHNFISMYRQGDAKFL
jgi:hypothetical protein